jgi:GMP synthase-like glutamine amidotransferase
MKPIAIFQHDPINFPAHFGDFLQQQGLPIRHIRLDLGEEVPVSAAEFSGLGFMGGVMSVNDEHIHPFLSEEFRIIREADQLGVPVIGHCLGGQLISKALGGRVSRNPVREIGWHALERVPGAVADEWLPDSQEKLMAMHWHSETFSLPTEAKLILRSAYCEHQAFVLRKCLALQAHVEVTDTVIDTWLGANADQLTPASEHLQTPDQIRQGLKQHLGTLRKLSDHFYRRWLALLAR